jgi:hypothetical protein
MHMCMKILPVIIMPVRLQLHCDAISCCNTSHGQTALDLFTHVECDIRHPPKLPQVEAKQSENDFSVAVGELHNKMAHWQAAYHGSREYILCCAIAGSKLRFYAVTRGGKQCKAISRKFCTNNVLDRLEMKDDLALHMTVAKGVANENTA